MSHAMSSSKLLQEGVSTVHLCDKQRIADLLQGVFLASREPLSSFGEEYHHISDLTDQQKSNTEAHDMLSADLENLNISDKMICSTCEEPFNDRAEQVLHYKSDWHRFNLKQKLKGEHHISKEKFMEITGDISSISGSETDSDTDHGLKSEVTEDSYEEEESYHLEGIGRRHPRVFFKNQNGELFSVYRCLLHGKRNQPETVDELLRLAVQLPEKLKWIVVMVAGGHFAAAVFDGREVVAHKTFHRYVVRAKRGTAQSAHDSQGGHAKSVGAFLRRHHEAALYEDIKKLLTEWASHLKSCDHIFLRAPGNNQKALFAGKDSPLSRHDIRLHMIPFPTRRPTFSEVKRVHDMLTAVYCYGTESKLTDHISPLKSKKPHKLKTLPKQASPAILEGSVVEATEIAVHADQDSSDSDIELVCNSETMTTEDLKKFDVVLKPKRRKKKKKNEIKPKVDQSSEEKQEPEVDDIAPDVFCGLRNDLYTAVKVGNLESLKSLVLQLEENGADLPTVMNKAVSLDGNLLLHIASKEGHSSLIRFLLERGADPSHRNTKNEFPYVASKDKETRNEFRRFVADYPDEYDYAGAQIPGPLTSEMEEERRAKEAEKRKLQKKARKERVRIQRDDEKAKKKEMQEKERFLSLSDREKRALAAEKRFTSQLKDQGVSETPILSRCFFCGHDITGTVPFEYSDNKFCTTKCLKQHRLKNKT